MTATNTTCDHSLVSEAQRLFHLLAQAATVERGTYVVLVVARDDKCCAGVVGNTEPGKTIAVLEHAVTGLVDRAIEPR